MEPVEVGKLERGDLFRWHPSALEPGEDPDEVYGVFEPGEHGGVQVRSVKNHGLPLGNPINTVGRHWLVIPTGQRVTPEMCDAE
jgi:hypothetical protein